MQLAPRHQASHQAIGGRPRGAATLAVSGILAIFSPAAYGSSAAYGQSAGNESAPAANPPGPPEYAQPASSESLPVALPPATPYQSGPRAAPQHDYSQALLFDVTTAFVPYANDVPLMVGVGVRFAGIHELWARVGYIPTGDDVGHSFGSGGYRVALRQHKRVRPLLGALFAGLPATCSHDELGQPVCTRNSLFIIAATVGVRIEPRPWLGIFSVLTLGTDTYPNPFGMIELGASFALPLS